MTAGAFARQIQGAHRGASGRWTGRCPAHEDRHASLSWADGREGLLVKCHAGCTAEAIAKALRIDVAEFFSRPGAAQPRTRAPGGSVAATYDYQDADGTLRYQVVRFEPKDFRTRRPDGQGGWSWNLQGVAPLLYRLPALLGAERVYVVEGEKDADRLASLGLAATCNHGGAGKWRPEHTESFRALGVREVVVIGDNDHPGEAHAQQVSAACAGAGLAVKLVRLPGLPERHDKHGEDVSDWLGQGWGLAELEAAVEKAPAWEPPRADRCQIEQRGEEWWATWPAAGIRFEFSAFGEERRAPMAEVRVWSERGAEPIEWQRIGLISRSGQADLAKSLAAKPEYESLDWPEIVGRSCRRVLEALRQPPEAVDLQPLEPTPDREWVPGWIPAGMVTVLFADGDSGKSLLALELILRAQEQRSLGGWRPGPLDGRVLYLDYECDAATHRRRLWRLRGDAPLLDPIKHIRLTYQQPIAEITPWLRQMIRLHGVSLVVVDSLTIASGPEPEFAAAALRTIGALASLGVTVLVLAHISKSSVDDRRAKPFGSAHIWNLGRSQIELRREDLGDGRRVLNMSLYSRKGNDLDPAQSFGLRAEFLASGRVEWQETTADMSKTSVVNQILNALSQAPDGLTVTALGAKCGAKQTVLRATLDRLEERNRVAKISEGGKGRGDKTIWIRKDA